MTQWKWKRSAPIAPREMATMSAYDAAVDRVVADLRNPEVGPMTTHSMAEGILGCALALRVDEPEGNERLEWIALLAATYLQRLVNP